MALSHRQRSHHIPAWMKAVMTDDGIPREGCAEDPRALPVIHHVPPEVRQATKSSIRLRLREALLLSPHASACTEAVQQSHALSPKTKSFSGHKEVSESIQIQQDYESGICSA